MFTHLEELKYTKDLVNVITYDSGLEEWIGVDERFDGQFVRNRVICKFDLLTTFTDLFKVETVENYREVVMLLFNRSYEDVEHLSEIIKALMDGDKIFRNKVTNIFYALKPNESLGEELLSYMSKRVLDQDSFYRDYFKGRPETFMFISDAYVYFAASDGDYIVDVPKRCRVEVISFAKNWDGSINFV